MCTWHTVQGALLPPMTSGPGNGMVMNRVLTKHCFLPEGFEFLKGASAAFNQTRGGNSTATLTFYLIDGEKILGVRR